MLHSIETETKGIGKADLSHSKPFADALHINLRGNCDSVAPVFPAEILIDLSQTRF